MSDTTEASAAAQDAAPEPGEPPSAASRPAAAADERLVYRGVFQRALVRPEIGAMIGAIGIWMFFWAVSVPFGTASGAQNILDQASTLGIMAVAVSMLMIGGEFDLSSGANTGAMGILTIFLVKETGELGGAGFPIWLGLIISFAVAMGIGWLNGFMVERTQLPSFIVTLATFFVLIGLKLGLSKRLVEKIEMGRMDEGTGYEFWRKVFAGEWRRLEHLLDVRDVVYTTLGLLGITLVVLAVYELHFERDRRPVARPLVQALTGGLALAAVGCLLIVIGDVVIGELLTDIDGVGAALTVLGVVVAALGAIVAFCAVVAAVGPLWAAGLAIGGAGVAILHLTDGYGGTAAGAVVIAVGALAAAIGLGKWGYRPSTKSGSIQLSSRILAPAGLGVLAVVVGLLVALVIDGDNDDNLFFPFTVQGLRATLFGIALIAGFTMLFIAASRAKRVNMQTKAAVSALTVVMVIVTAFVIQNEAGSYKFRNEAFSVMLIAALLLVCWTVAGLLFEERRAADLEVGRFANRVLVAGIFFVSVALVVKTLFITQDELDRGVTPAIFSMRIVWFVLFTAVMVWVLGQTRFGSWTFAVGGNKQAARQVGVPAARTKTQLFMLVSGAAWIVGVLVGFRINAIQANQGDGQEFIFIIAAVVGGTLLTGGYGTALGGAIGALVMSMAILGIPNSRWESDWRFLFLGVILLTAVIANRFIREKAEAMRA